MYRKSIILALVLVMAMLWSCESTDTNENTEIESTILGLISADDSTYAINGLYDDEFSLAKKSTDVESGLTMTSDVVMDSNYVWRFRRSDMNSVREVTVEVENDSAAMALISHHVTGVFHTRQFERVWTSDSTWLPGDSVQFTQKNIDMTVDRRVRFRNRTLANGTEHWMPISMTLAYGSTGSGLDIESMDWVAEDSVQTLDAFDTTFYGRFNPLSFVMMGANQIDVMVSNDVADEAETVIGRFGFNPRLQGPDLRNRIHFRYAGSSEGGDKIYSRTIPAINRPLRHFKGFVEVLDHRTLFDHDYPEYSAATVGFVYKMRHQRP